MLIEILLMLLQMIHRLLNTNQVFLKTLADIDARIFKNVKIVVPIKYLSNFFKFLEMSLINFKIHLELNWIKDCVIPNIAGETTFKIKNRKLYVPVVILSTKENVYLTKQLNEGFKTPFYWN